MKKTIVMLLSVIAAVIVFNQPILANTTFKSSDSITIVVGYAAGGPADLSARTVADKMSEYLKIPVRIENKTGGAATAAHRFVKSSQPNGLTLALSSPSPMGAGTLFEKDPGFTSDDFEGVGTIYSLPRFMFTGSALPNTNFADVVSVLKKNPKKFTAGGSVNGLEQLTNMILNQTAGVEVNFAGYKGGAPASLDLYGGHIHIMYDFLSTVAPSIKDGRATPMAVSWPNRLPDHPNVPTWKEVGFPAEISTGQWFGLLAPKGTPKNTLDQLNAALRYATNDPGVKEKIKAMGAYVVNDTGTQLKEQITKEYNRYQSIGKMFNIVPQ